MRAPKSNVVAMPRPKVDDVYLAMAASEMDARGRLFEPEVVPEGLGAMPPKDPPA